MHKPVLDLLRVLSSALTLPVPSVLLLIPLSLDSIRSFRERPMSVAQGLLALLALQGLQVLPADHRDPKGLKASQALQDRQEQLAQQGHEACKAYRVSQDRQE
jgi:hypothetical protein